MRFKSQTEIGKNELDRALRSVVADGITSHLMGVLTGGVFLVALAVKLGASNFQIGLIAAVTPLMQFIQLPAVFLIEKVRSRKSVAIYSALIGRFGFLLIALAPFLFAPEAALTVLVIAVLFYSAFGAAGGCAWNSWMRDLVPEGQMGSFFSRRLRVATFLGIFVSLLASVFVDFWKGSFPAAEIYVYSWLFGAGFILGIIGTIFLARTPEPVMKSEPADFLKILIQPFQNINFRRLMLALGSWSFAVNLAAPFFTVYMLTRLGLPMSTIVILSVVSQVFNFAFLSLWGRWTDRFSNKSVFAVSGPLFIFSILGWTFTTMPEKYFLTFPILIAIHIVMGIATAGITIASGNIGLKLAPRGQATAYLAANSMVNSFAAALAPILGGKFADFFASRNLSFIFKWASPRRELTFQALNFQHWDFFFALAFLIGLYALHRLSMVQEQGEVDEQVVRDEFIEVIKRPLRSLSSGAGIFQLIAYPYSFLTRGVKFIEKATSPSGRK